MGSDQGLNFGQAGARAVHLPVPRRQLAHVILLPFAKG
jgi:hypothetical protein